MSDIKDKEVSVKVYLIDDTGKQITKGSVIPVEKDNSISLRTATSLIDNFTASKIKEDNALVVTAHLNNGETLSDVYSTKSKNDFFPDLAIDSSKMKLTHQVWEALQTLYAFAAKD